MSIISRNENRFPSHHEPGYFTVRPERQQPAGVPCAIVQRLEFAAVQIDLPPPLELNVAGKKTNFAYMESNISPAVTRFSHVVVFWTDPAQPNAADELMAGANQYLKDIPGVLLFHVGKMSSSPRPVVEQSYQVALNLVFPSKAAEQAYQVHPQHLEFVEKVFKRVCRKVVIYDFE